MQKTVFSLVICNLIANIYGMYNGPFMLFGLSELKDIEKSSLQYLDDKLLRDLYTDAAAVVVFLKNATTKLSNENFPSFKHLIDEHAWVYLPQGELSADPLDYNVNAEVINLVGAPEQQDIELAAMYRDAVVNYGDRKVLGILASRWDDNHSIKKREAIERVSTTSETPEVTVKQEEQSDYIYHAPLPEYKSILYTASPPILYILGMEYELKTHGIVTVDERDQLSRLIVTFKSDDGAKLTLRFRFPISQGYWELSSVEVEDTTTTILKVVGSPPTAPIGFSYKCSGQLYFENGNINLTLNNYQVQPLIGNATKFSSAIDCVDFTSAPIWAGVFLTFIMLSVMTIAITAILDIKPPNRFENRSGKQLTFTIAD